MSPGAVGLAGEAALLSASQGGDPEAIRALVRLYEPQLLRLALRLVGRTAIAEEIVQEALYRMFREIPRIETRQGARPWLLRTLLNLARSHRRRHSQAEISGEIEGAESDLFGMRVANPEQQTASGEVRRCVDEALGKLSPKLREVILLHYAEGLSFPELASILKVPAPVLRVRAVRARAQLRTLLSGIAP